MASRIRPRCQEPDERRFTAAQPIAALGRDTRIQRLRTLRRTWADHGIPARFDLVKGIAHRGLDVQPTVRAFMAETMAQARNRQAS